MKKILFFLIILCGWNQVLASTITTSHESGIVPYGTPITFTSLSGDTVWYEWGGRPITVSSPYFIISITLTAPTPDEGDPEHAHINTSSISISQIASWMGSGYTQQDADYLALDSVWKTNTIRLHTSNNERDQVFIYMDPMTLMRHLGIPIVGLNIKHEDAFDPSTGFMMQGDCSQVQQCFYDTIVDADTGTVMIDTVGSLTVMAPNTISVYGFNVLTEDGWMFIDSILFSLIDSIAYISISDSMYGPHHFEEDIREVSFINDSLAFSFGNVELSIEEECIFYSWQDTCPSNFDINPGEFNSYPELDKSVYKKDAHLFMYMDDQVVYDDWSTVRIGGNSSRYHPTKSFVVKVYKENPITYDIFGNNITTHRTVYFRKFGSIKGTYILNDPIVQALSQGHDIGAQAGRPVILYLNGEYWGLYWMQERDDRYYVQSHEGVDDDDVIMFSYNDGAGVLSPKNNHRDSFNVYEEMYILDDYLDTVQINRPGVVGEVLKMLHFVGFIKQEFTQAGMGNVDNGGNNTSVWISRNTGIFNTIVKDYDLAFFDWTTNHFDVFLHSYDTAVIGGTQGIIQAAVFNKLVGNDTLRWIAIGCEADLRTTSHNVDTMVATVNRLGNQILPHLDANYARVGHLNFAEADSFSMASWGIPGLLTFASERPTLIDSFFINDFVEVTGTTQMFLKIQNPTGCNFSQEHTIWANTLEVTSENWFERHCYDVPTPLTSRYPVAYWVVNNDTLYEQSPWVHVDKDSVYYVTAIFECALVDSNSNLLSISETQPDNKSGIVDEENKHEDWLELFNSSDDSINLFGLFLSDKLSNLQKYQILIDTVLAPGEYIVFWADEDMSDGFPHTNFKLSKNGEGIYLSDGINIIDSLVWNFTIPEDSSFGICEEGVQVMSPTPGVINDCIESTILGINFTSFSVMPNDEDCLVLEWVSAGEVGLFTTTLRSTDGENWDTLAVVSGDTYVDCEIQLGTTYYYQLIVEQDSSDIQSGSITTTGIREIHVNVIPNPSDGNIRAYGDCLFTIYNAWGQEILSGESGIDYYIDVAPGIYFCVFTNRQTNESAGEQKLIIE